MQFVAKSQSARRNQADAKIIVICRKENKIEIMIICLFTLVGTDQ